MERVNRYLQTAVSVWTACVNFMPYIIMPNLQTDRSRCTNTCFNTLEDKYKPLVLKELKKLWENKAICLPSQRGFYDESNTILLDDSPYKALCNPGQMVIFACISKDWQKLRMFRSSLRQIHLVKSPSHQLTLHGISTPKLLENMQTSKKKELLIPVALLISHCIADGVNTWLSWRISGCGSGNHLDNLIVVDV
ncbi:hypothetical protein KSS87_017169 [Heliosperma pusillum]|nr:hypothetical protein KSS87_017169 [Heliosperma pusillum]